MTINLMNYRADRVSVGNVTDERRELRVTGYYPNPNSDNEDAAFEIEMVGAAGRLVLTAQEWEILKNLMLPLEGM